jgi:ATP-dependent Lhr-like helicase
MQQNLRCNSQNYRLDAATLLQVEGNRVTGRWVDKVYSLDGTVQGRVTADGFQGLRALLVPSEKRAPFADQARKRHHKTVTGVEFAGRWSLLRPQVAPTTALSSADSAAATSRPSFPNGSTGRLVGTPAPPPGPAREAAVETYARVLLRRYGVVFRRLMERESLKVAWFELGRVFRRLEARGEIRGGYFISGVSGEQFALAEAVGLLRSLRKRPPGGQWIALSAADPLNLAGILTPGPRITAIAPNRILLRDGLPVAALESGNVFRLDGGVGSVDEQEMERALKVGSLPAVLRPYYG